MGEKHYDKLCAIFNDKTATGINAHPSTKSPTWSEDEKDKELYPTNILEYVGEPNKKHGRHTQISTSKRSRRAKRESLSSSISKALEMMNENSKRRAEALERVATRSFEVNQDNGSTSGNHYAQDRVKVQECLDALKSLEGIDGAVYTKALKALHDHELWRDMFLGMPNDRKKDWIINL
ncbi:hypothetical protein CFOL_v3_24268 [Cephalotus follicularis]|uniref:Uncharacterized protein n=1 Tax=Cephalotus follicularis TaxID=3775 RepID=A0A1Q3CL61_CEPFO|nr:hypothetical protein CFOL_v3_24268 [Cephalotus follicularis]